MKITKKQAAAGAFGVLGLGAAALILSGNADGSTSTPTYGGETGAGMEYGGEMEGLNALYEGWLSSVTPQNQAQQVPLLDTPPIWAIWAMSDTAQQAEAAGNESGGFIDKLLNTLSAPSAFVSAVPIVTKAIASPLPLPLSLGVEVGNWAGGEFVTRFRDSAAKREAERLGGIGQGFGNAPIVSKTSSSNSKKTTPSSSGSRKSSGGFGSARIINPPSTPKKETVGTGMGSGGIGGGFGGGFGGAR